MMLLRTIEVTFMNLSSHAFRSILAALGVVLGVGAVVGMLAISEGARKESLARIRAQGIDNIFINSKEPSVQDNEDGGQSSILEYGLTQRDLRHIATAFDNVDSLVPARNMRKIIYVGGKATDIMMLATKPDFLRVTGARLDDERGRWLMPSDEDKLRAVCVIGRDAARKLLQFRDPLGATIKANGVSFRIVGVLADDHGTQLDGTQDLNNIVYVPFETANSLYGQIQTVFRNEDNIERTRVEIDHLFIKVQDFSQLPNTVARIRSYLKTTHGAIDYSLQVPLELLKQEEATQRIFTIVMASIAAISLIVGGIGIMNIMLANIYERTQEIGTLRALGAKKRDILVQFLIESVVLTASGGALGLAVGVGIAELVQYYAGMQTQVSSLSIIVSLTVSVMTGVLFGTYPAWKAANLDPIVALKRD